MLVIGAADAGKTTFTAWLATALSAQGLTVAILDADVGQSEIGPPGAVGLGRVTKPLTRPADAELVALEFVGVTSPGRRPSHVVEAVRRLVSRAREQFQRVIVDTSGFVAGGFGASVKQRKIAVVDPDVIVLIQQRDEAEHIVRGLEARARPRLVRLPAMGAVRTRSAAARRLHRDAALARHLEGARLVALDVHRVAIRGITGEPRALGEIAVGAIAGLHTHDGDTIALGVVEAKDEERGCLLMRTTRTVEEISAVTIGEMTAA